MTAAPPSPLRGDGLLGVALAAWARLAPEAAADVVDLRHAAADDSDRRASALPATED